MKKTGMVARTARELLGRFTPTQLAADLIVMGKTIRFETNHESVLKQTVRAFSPYSGAPVAREARFTWKLVVDPDAGLSPPWPTMTAFDGFGLRCVNIGQRSFVAVDLEAREAVSFLAEGLACDESGFRSLFLRTFFTMTADALGLTAVPAASISRNDYAVLVFHEQDTSRAVSSSRGGLQNQVTCVTFLELAGGKLHAWEQFWPVVSREEFLEALEYASENREGDASGKGGSSGWAPSSRSRIPLACVFLGSPGQGRTDLIPLHLEEVIKRLESCSPMVSKSLSNRDSTLGRLCGLPGYKVQGTKQLSAVVSLCAGLLVELEERTRPAY